MRAAVFKGPGRLFCVEEAPDPTPGPGQLLLKVHRCGVCGTDVHLTSGKGSVGHAPGSILGHEYAGEIVELGAGVTDFRVGELVTAIPSMGCGHCDFCAVGDPMRCPRKLSCSHGFAEYVLAGASSSVKLPATVSVAEAALTEPLSCGLRGIQRAKMAPGSRVLVIGAGSIGLAAVYWARRMGAGRIVVTARSSRAARIAVELGADQFIVADDDLGANAAQALGGAPDLVVESAGAEGMIAKSIEIVKLGGTVVVLGYCTVPDAFLPCRGIDKEVSLIFSFVYTRADFEHSLRVMDAGDRVAQAMITDTVSLDAFPTALEALRGVTDQCKVQLDPWKS